MKKAKEAIIRPRRKIYDLTQLPISFTYSGMRFTRCPCTYQNKRNLRLIGSVYYLEEKPIISGDPCVIYLHGNASSQLEGRFLIPNLCPHGIAVFCFDFAGCGESDGEYISLGYYESFDTKFLINLLTVQFGFSKFILWGRSMGAATALLVHHPSVVACISDSAYISVESMVETISKKTDIPFLFRPFASWLLKESVDSTAFFDYREINVLESIKKIKVPVIIGHAENDQIVPFEHSQLLYQACPNVMKLFMKLPGGHNSPRPIEWIKLCVSFCIDQLGVRHDGELRLFECTDLQDFDAHFEKSSDFISKKKRKGWSEDGDDGVRSKSRRNYSDDEI